MQSVSIRVLLVANNEQEHTRVAELLSQASTQTFTLASASTYEQGLAAILAGSCDVCLVLGGEPSRLDLLAEAAAKPDHPQIILLTAEGNLAVDLPAAKAGAADHLIEGELTPALLERSILYALERGRAQKALRDAGESQSLSLAKTAFLATMSHEMRTPMNSILGMADTLWESPLNHEQTRCVEVLRRNASGLLTLINDILDLSIIESGQLELERVPFDLEELVDHVIDFTAVKARAKDLVLLSHFLAGIPTSLMGDPARLSQVLTALIGNAIKFTDSGEVLLTIHNNESGNSGEIDFDVSDTGVGIPPDKLETIFENFTQGDTSATREYSGAGLGLAISRRLVEAMGGVLTAANGAVKGSSFRFTIRFDLAGETRRTDRTSLEGTPGRPAAPRRILIVDDSPDNSWLVEVYLKGKQYRLTFEEDGLAAVTRFGLENFDLVLMDIQMPVMDGLTATRAIRELERERGRPRIPILALTASSSLQDMERSFEAGCDAHLAKPISKLELTTAVDRYLREPGSGETAQTKFGEKIRIEVPPGLAQIVPPYLARRKKEVPEMFDFLAKSDFVRLAALGHNLKGTGGGYGFLELTHLGSWLEQSAKQQDAEALHKRITDVNNYLDRVQLV